jgi:hypothetical protein
MNFIHYIKVKQNFHNMDLKAKKDAEFHVDFKNINFLGEKRTNKKSSKTTGHGSEKFFELN